MSERLPIKLQVEDFALLPRGEGGLPTEAKKTIASYTPPPLHVLPTTVRKYIEEAAAAIGCDAAYVLLPLVAVLGAAIGNTRRIRLKRRFVLPPLIWTGIIGWSGTAKSPALEAATRIPRRLQADAFRRFESAMESFEGDRLEYEKELNVYKRGNRPEPPEKPQPPRAQRIIANDLRVWKKITVTFCDSAEHEFCS
jgi:hypothetical protein